jgi:hypothetical protein
MTPSETIIAAAAAAPVVTDADGRRIALRRLSALDKLRLFKAAGPVLAQNQPWLGMAVLACSVVAIDDVPVPSPATEHQIEAMVARLGDNGIDAIAAALDGEPGADAPDAMATAGNSAGTPT